MARKYRDDFASQDAESEPVICPLCERVIPDDQIEDPAIQKFVSWVKTKPPGFDDEAEERGRRR